MKSEEHNQKSGLLVYEDRKKSQGYVDVRQLNDRELRELIRRQESLLNNKSFILKLPDKGSKILSFKKEIENELNQRNRELDTTCMLLADLNIRNSKPEDIEWCDGKNLDVTKKTNNRDDDDDDDDDEDSDEDVDALKLIANHSGTIQKHRKKIKIPMPTLITENDLKEIKEMSHIEYLCDKFGKAMAVKPRFKLNQLKGNSSDQFAASAENVKKRLNEKWEVTEATPPVPIYKEAKMISLSESLSLQKTQAEKLKEIERQQAVERLLKNQNIKMGNSLPIQNTLEYRSVAETFDETNDSEEEIQPEEKEEVPFYNLLDNV